jgi:endonuclease YncB( thermonuclease family)
MISAGEICGEPRAMRKGLGVDLSYISEANLPVKCLEGPAMVIDGDTIIVAGERVRIHGIDAPELDQTFWCRGQTLPCGVMASAALETLITGINLRCDVIERDQHDRLVAKCFSPNGIDVGRRLVLAGWALAYRYFSTDYVEVEDEARKAERGLWRGSFLKPWRWRESIRSMDDNDRQ